MKIFVNQDIRRFYFAVVFFLLAAVVAGQIVVRSAANDTKNAVIAHDAGVVGALIQQGIDPAVAVAAVTGSLTDEERSTGRLVLETAGISAEVQYRFVPIAVDLSRRYGSTTLIAGLSFSIIALFSLFFFFARQEKQIERASLVIERFMQAGEQQNNRQAALNLVKGSLAEGSLAQLFSAVNGMAASLTAHIQKEQHDREFLKDTISDISHQLKTPLAALQMYIEIIREERTANPVIDDFTLKSQRELNRMEYLIQNLMKLARLDAGAIVLEKCPLKLSSFLEDILESFFVRAEIEGKQTRLFCPQGLTLYGDEHWLAEAVSNLVKNAFDHTKTGGSIEVTCDETPLLVTISVQDDGMGIHPEDLPHIFKRFYRSRYSQDHQGVGIGLTLAHSIVEKHGGSMIADSQPGQGAVFRMTFPKLSNL